VGDKKTVSLTQFGKRLGTRWEGTQAREVLRREIQALGQPGLLVVDFRGLEVLSGSFADEALGELLATLVEGALPGRYVMGRATREEILEDLNLKLAERKLALLVGLGGKNWTAVGKLPPYLEEALRWVMDRGWGRSAELAQELGLTVQQASMRLLALGQLRLVHMEAESRAGGGYQWRAQSLCSFISGR